MKVLFDNEAFLSQKYGGVTRYFYELISRLPSDDLDVLLYMGRFICEYGLENHKDKFKVFFGKKRRNIPKTKLISAIIQKPLFERFAEKQEFDILHQTYFGDININKSFKQIITIHDFTHERLGDNFSKLDKTAEHKKKAIDKSDGIICVSESTKSDLLSMYDVGNKKVKVVYHGNSLVYDVSEPPVIKEPYLLYVGDRRAYKNFGILIKLFGSDERLRKNYKLVCCGGGKFSKSETEQINSAGLAGNFLQTEAYDGKIANLYRYAFAFIYPSKYEGFGIPMIEAMHNKCPVVAAGVTSLPEVGADAALYFNPESYEDLKSKINMLLDNENLRMNLISKGIEREKFFSWDKCAAETKSFYEEVMRS
ncbi:MAG: glycosyltransferase family 4 protein [Bacteroidetes bacterium]|nr:glycosyltransferase family 4 protein [Bacteroidota bacterium]